MFEFRVAGLMFLIGCTECSTEILRKGGGDSYVGTRCGKNSLQDGNVCKCKSPYDTFYGSNTFFLCSTLTNTPYQVGLQSTPIVQVEKCHVAVVYNHLKSEILVQPPLACKPSSRDRVKIYVRNINRDGRTMYWDESFSSNILKSNVVLKDEKVYISNRHQFQGLLLKFIYKCANVLTVKCILVKVTGTRKYPIIWNAPTVTTTKATITNIGENEANNNNDDDPKTPLIVGLIVGGVGIVMLIVAVVLCHVSRRRRHQKQTNACNDSSVSKVNGLTKKDNEFDIRREDLKQYEDRYTEVTHDQRQTNEEVKDDHNYASLNMKDINTNVEYTDLTPTPKTVNIGETQQSYPSVKRNGSSRSEHLYEVNIPSKEIKYRGYEVYE